MGDLWDSLAPVGNWLTGGTAPWWAALLTFYLGQRFSLRGAKEQREADAQAREAERQHALTIVAAEHDAAARRAKAEAEAAAEASERETARRQVEIEVDAKRQVIARAVEATSNLRAHAAGLEQFALLPVEVHNEFLAACSAVEVSVCPHDYGPALEEVNKFQLARRDTDASESDIVGLDRALSHYLVVLGTIRAHLT